MNENKISEKQKPFNSNHLKLIAIIAMTIDHVTDLFFPNFPPLVLPSMLHVIGRLTAPIMWFFICEGFHYTRDIKKYILRLGIFAVISHFAYCFGFGIDFVPLRKSIFNQTSVMYPLFIAVVVLWIQSEKVRLNGFVKFMLNFVLIISAFPADWSCIAVLAIIHMHKNRGNLERQFLAILACLVLYGTVSWFFVSRSYALILFGVLLVYPLLKNYNGQKGKASWMKWFFYIYYPAHLVLIGIARTLIYESGNISL